MLQVEKRRGPEWSPVEHQQHEAPPLDKQTQRRSRGGSDGSVRQENTVMFHLDEAEVLTSE